MGTTKNTGQSSSSKRGVSSSKGEYTTKMIAVFLALIIIGTGFAVAFHYLDDSENGDEVEKNKYVQSIELGGEWFLNNQDESFLYYEYNFFGKNHSSSHHSLREMGALWSISMLDDFLDDDRYSELARKGFSHFQEHFVHDQENDFLYINIPQKLYYPCPRGISAHPPLNSYARTVWTPHPRLWALKCVFLT